MRNSGSCLVTAVFATALLAGGSSYAQEAGTANKTYRLALPVIAKRTVFANIKDQGEAAAEAQQDVVDRAGVGPKAQSIRLQDVLRPRGLNDFGLTSIEGLTNLSLEAYEDGNPASGIYYYKPRMYFLHWTAVEQYYLTVDYLPRRDSDKNVVIDARLTPGDVRDDVRVIKRLLKAALRQRPAHLRPPNLDEIQLLPLPALYEAEINWQGLGVPEGDVLVTGVDRETGQIGLQVITDVATKEILIKKLGDPQGLQAGVNISPQQVTPEQEPIGAFYVNARLKLADSEAYARALWQRTPGTEHSLFRNQHAFPVQLRKLCYLYDDGRHLFLRGYDLRAHRTLPPDGVLPPGGIAKVSNQDILEQIDDGDRVIRAWYDYSLVNDQRYRDQVIDALTGGVGSVPVTEVTIQVVNSARLFEQYNLFKLGIVVRSRYFDPSGESTDWIEQGYELAAGEDSSSVAPLYAPEDAPGSLYEYKIGLITGEGASHEDTAWRSPVGLLGTSIFIGSKQIEEVLAE